MIRKSIIIILTFIAVVSVPLMVMSYVPASFKTNYQSRYLMISGFGSGWFITLSYGNYMENSLDLRCSQGTIIASYRCKVEPQNSYSYNTKFAGFEISKAIGRHTVSKSGVVRNDISKLFSKQERIRYLWPTCRTDVKYPSWFPVVLFGFYPVLAFYRGPVRRWRRDRQGGCKKCGYNLTGNESGVCPECGTEIKI